MTYSRDGYPITGRKRENSYHFSYSQYIIGGIPDKEERRGLYVLSFRIVEIGFQINLEWIWQALYPVIDKKIIFAVNKGG